MKKILITLIAMASSFAMAAVTPFSVNADADGFTGWTEQLTSGDGGQNGSFIGSSGTSMDVNGDSWGLYANSSQTAARIYDFGDILAANQSVTISVSLGFINNGGTVGIGLQNSSGTNRFETYYIGGDATNAWKLNDAEGQENITGPTTTFASSSWSNNNFQEITFTQLAGNTYSLSFDGVGVTNNNLNLADSDISQIRIFNFNAGSGSGFNQYYNSLSVIPEPSSLVLYGLTGVAAVGVLMFKRRRR